MSTIEAYSGTEFPPPRSRCHANNPVSNGSNDGGTLFYHVNYWIAAFFLRNGHSWIKSGAGSAAVRKQMVTAEPRYLCRAKCRGRRVLVPARFCNRSQEFDA
jgi:hypothetical protein